MNKNSLQVIIRTILIVWMLSLFGCSVPKKKTSSSDIIIENTELRLVLSSDGTAQSLIHKASGQECLMEGIKVPAFTISQDRPYDNELQLAYPAKPKTFAADSIYRKGDDLIVNYELSDYEATIGLKITDEYIGFELKKFEYHMANFGVKRKTIIDEFILLQLPLKNREHFGEWLNVMWDNDVAINLLGTNTSTRIDAEKLQGYKIFQAGGIGDIKMEGVEAVLIVTEKSKLLDHIDRVERDFGLPLGVESRRSKDYKYSYYELRDVTKNNIDKHIEFAKKAGFRQMVIYYPDFAKSMGHFPWRDEYPNGMDNLKEITHKIEAAGMIPGFHIHYNKANLNDPYVTPVPDSRLNLIRFFSLKKDLDKNSTIITVEENPVGCTIDDGRRLLKIGNEIVSYKSYTENPPYQFTGCQRGVLNTSVTKLKAGGLIGLLDVDTWPAFIRFNQNTTIQEEVAKRLATIIKEAGFKFLYFDGAEDVPPPYWYNVSKAQMEVYDALENKPVFSEGALKSHFGWHILTRGNAFDIFQPEVIKEATRKHPIAEMKLVSNDFTSVDFGWIGYVSPDKETIGMQPDMLEYVTSRAAGWNSIISLIGNLNHLKKHARTDDNLEVIRRWEEARATNLLTSEQKKNLRDEYQEHILLVNEDAKLELVPYKQIENVANRNKEIRAFVFNRNNKTWVVYWHISGGKTMELAIDPKEISLFEILGKKIPVESNNGLVTVPVDKRRYIQFNLSIKEVIKLFSDAKIQ